MIKGEGRIGLAAVAVFGSLFGMAAALHGLLDETAIAYYGVLAVFIAATTFVVLLTPLPGDELDP